MDFLEKMKPHLLTNDPIVLEFVMHSLREYPNLPIDWADLLLKEAKQSKEKEALILTNLDKFPFSDEAIKMLAEGFRTAPPEKKHMYGMILLRIEPEMIIKHRDLLEGIITSEGLEMNDFLQNGSREEIWENYSYVLDQMQQEQFFNQQLFTAAKKMAQVLVKKGWMEEDFIDRTLEEQMKKKYFDSTGIAAVYLAGLMKQQKHIPLLVSLLSRDEDILLEVVADAIISFQNDEVVKSMEQLSIDPDGDIIFVTSVLGEVKSPLAVQKLRELYNQTTDLENQTMIVEALCHQLSEEALPEIEKFASEEFTSSLIDPDRLLYGYFKVMGINHPKLAEWLETANEREKEFNEAQMKYQ